MCVRSNCYNNHPIPLVRKAIETICYKIFNIKSIPFMSNNYKHDYTQDYYYHKSSRDLPTIHNIYTIVTYILVFT